MNECYLCVRNLQNALRYLARVRITVTLGPGLGLGARVMFKLEICKFRFRNCLAHFAIAQTDKSRAISLLLTISLHAAAMGKMRNCVMRNV